MRLVIVIISTVSVLAMSLSVRAQSAWLNHNKNSSVSLEWNKPIFDEDIFSREYVKSASSVLFVTGRFRVNDKVRFVADLPLSHFGEESSEFFEGSDHTAFGNIYVGGEFDIHSENPNTSPFFELGVRIPTMGNYNDPDEHGALTGLLAETDRKEAFLNNTWSIPVAINLINNVTDQVVILFRAGTIYDIYTGDWAEFLDNDLNVIYAVGTTLQTEVADAHLSFSGRHHAAGNDPGGNGLTQIRAGVKTTARMVARLSYLDATQ